MERDKRFAGKRNEKGDNRRIKSEKMWKKN